MDIYPRRDELSTLDPQGSPYSRLSGQPSLGFRPTFQPQRFRNGADLDIIDDPRNPVYVVTEKVPISFDMRARDETDATGRGIVDSRRSMLPHACSDDAHHPCRPLSHQAQPG